MTNDVIELDLEQGSQPWLDNRMITRPASELAAVMNISPYMDRRDVVRVRATGNPIEYSNYVKNVIFPNGHRVEPIVRAMLERDLDEDFIPKCFVKAGRYSCSLDGQNILGDTNIEIKQYGKEVYESVANGILPVYHKPQVQQGLWISGADKCIFAVCSEDEQSYVSMEVYPDTEFCNDIPRHWEKYDEDVANYTDIEQVEFMAAGEKDMLLPIAEIKGGEIVLSSNIKGWFATKKSEFEGLPKVIDTENAGQFKTIGDNLDEAKNALNIVIKALEEKSKPLNDHIKELKAIAKELASNAAYCANTLADFRKSIRQKACDDATKAFNLYLSESSEKFSDYEIVINVAAPDFMAACNRTRNHESLANAVDSALANAKIEVDKKAEDYRAKLDWLEENDTAFIIADLQPIIDKPMDDFMAIVQVRIASHKAETESAIIAEQEQPESEELETKSEPVSEIDEKIADLRDRAKSIATSAQYADNGTIRRQELRVAADLNHQADELDRSKDSEQDDREKIIAQAVQEVEQHQEQLKTPFYEVKPKFFRAETLRLISAKFAVTIDQAEQWAIEEFATEDA